MLRHLSTPLVALIAFAVGAQAQAACTAGNPNANLAESTPTNAFTVNASAGTVTHHLTGLTWKQCREGYSGPGCATQSFLVYGWQYALGLAAADTTDGGGWRLPNAKELQSIVETCGYNPAINQTVFPGLGNGQTWSATTNPDNPGSARYVDFFDGYFTTRGKTEGQGVRLVRGGQSLDTFDAQFGSTPSAFSFTAQTGVALGASATSNTITVAGITTASAISIVGGTYSVNGGAYTATSGTVINGDTVTVKLTASGSYSTMTTAILSVGGINNTAFNVTTLKAPVAPVTIPLLPVAISGTNSLPSIVNLGGGAGPNFVNYLEILMSQVLGMQSRMIEQNAQGTVTMSGYRGGSLSFVPLSFQTGNSQANGIYAVGNGQYQVVANGQSLLIAPAIVRLDQLTALLPGVLASQADNGVITASYNGVVYVIQPGALVQTSIPNGSARLIFGNDGYYHFVDTQGNAQQLFPAFAETSTLNGALQGLFPGATWSIQLDGTALMVFNGQSYTLVPDITLGNIPLERAGQSWWQESTQRYRVVNVMVPLATGTSQGFTIKK
jgi:hypothetical protein